MKKLERVVVREFDKERDGREVEELERRCEVGPTGKLSIFTHLLGDPLCRIRHSPAFLMLVAELWREGDGGVGEEKGETVGMVRGCIKTVTCGKKQARQYEYEDDSQPLPIFTKVAYILGLRVSPFHRRKGIALKLVNKIEEWFRNNGAEYSYMATESDNHASISLFTHKCGYSKFRTPSILVQPVFAHRAKLSGRVTILRLPRNDAEALYRRKFSTTEFFPRDIDAVLSNRLSLGTFLAVPRRWGRVRAGIDGFLADPPESWAVASVWDCGGSWRMEVKGASCMRKELVRVSRAVDWALPWLRLPSFPDVFGPFGVHFMYGLGGEGPNAVSMVRALCGLAHNLAREHGCSVVAAEVASMDPLRLGIPHWKRLSCAEDLWCIKRLREDYSDGAAGDWTKSAPGSSIFVDPREF